MCKNTPPVAFNDIVLHASKLRQSIYNIYDPVREKTNNLGCTVTDVAQKPAGQKIIFVPPPPHKRFDSFIIKTIKWANF